MSKCVISRTRLAEDLEFLFLWQQEGGKVSNGGSDQIHVEMHSDLACVVMVPQQSHHLKRKKFRKKQKNKNERKKETIIIINTCHNRVSKFWAMVIKIPV